MILALFALTIIALFSFLALAIDLGLIAMARTQCQAAADAAAMAGARTLNGSTGNNYGNASPDAVQSATNNSILGKQVTSSQVTINIGRYTYDATNKRFEGEFPGPSTDNWTLVQAVVTTNLSGQLAFSKIFNFTPSSITTKSTAVHRPRDICIVLDYSGSMRFASLTGVGPFDNPRSCNNPDSNYPTWGAYSGSNASMQATSFNFAVRRSEHHHDDQRRPTADLRRFLSGFERHAGLHDRVERLRDHARRRRAAQIEQEHRQRVTPKHWHPSSTSPAPETAPATRPTSPKAIRPTA